MAVLVQQLLSTDGHGLLECWEKSTVDGHALAALAIAGGLGEELCRAQLNSPKARRSSRKSREVSESRSRQVTTGEEALMPYHSFHDDGQKTWL